MESKRLFSLPSSSLSFMLEGSVFSALDNVTFFSNHLGNSKLIILILLYLSDTWGGKWRKAVGTIQKEKDQLKEICV